MCVWMPAAMHARQRARQLVKGNLLRGRGGQMREKQRCFSSSPSLFSYIFTGFVRSCSGRGSSHLSDVCTFTSHTDHFLLAAFNENICESVLVKSQKPYYNNAAAKTQFKHLLQSCPLHTHTHTHCLLPFFPLLPSGFSILILYWSSEISLWNPS